MQKTNISQGSSHHVFHFRAYKKQARAQRQMWNHLVKDSYVSHDIFPGLIAQKVLRLAVDRRKKMSKRQRRNDNNNNYNNSHHNSREKKTIDFNPSCFHSCTFQCCLRTGNLVHNLGGVAHHASIRENCNRNLFVVLFWWKKSWRFLLYKFHVKPASQYEYELVSLTNIKAPYDMDWQSDSFQTCHNGPSLENLICDRVKGSTSIDWYGTFRKSNAASRIKVELWKMKMLSMTLNSSISLTHLKHLVSFRTM